MLDIDETHAYDMLMEKIARLQKELAEETMWVDTGITNEHAKIRDHLLTHQKRLTELLEMTQQGI
jgi:hypothetical protein